MNPSQFFAIQSQRIPQNNGMPKGGRPFLTPDEAAHYCQGMPEHQYLAAKLYWAKDWSGIAKLEYMLWDAAVNIRIREKWRIDEKYRGKEMLRRLAGLALFEVADPSRFRPEDAWKIRAAWMGVEKGAWFKTWRPRYEMVYGELNEWVNDAWRHVKKQIAGDKIDG